LVRKRIFAEPLNHQPDIYLDNFDPIVRYEFNRTVIPDPSSGRALPVAKHYEGVVGESN
jgi:hypothetical protein